MGMIFHAVKFAAGATANLIGSAVVKACLPRMPPCNWNTSNTAIFPVSTTCPARAKRELEYKCRPILPVQDEEVYFESRHLFDMEEPSVSVKIESGGSEQGDTTLWSVDDSSTVDFSIYSDASCPDLNKAVFITPAPPSLYDTRDVDCTVLMEASERISEILRENRRRLDAGEDPCISRREARRKRAQELSAVRKARLHLF
ncbi:hypothetical protein CVT25_015742 [Psilocybe cyanescens]|uniref:Uncharacterized protein n=1 Tax=Psilocybe cyanescens TaxID=93625 RepID=A0A409WRS9_PSICY|nr:hypothetical protein CVT25_015742 [Psilocybe cyanescens]